jgi:hypothetical protein
MAIKRLVFGVWCLNFGASLELGGWNLVLPCPIIPRDKLPRALSDLMWKLT